MKRLPRKISIGLAKVAGYHRDNSAFTTLRVESGVSLGVLLGAWKEGVQAAENGVRCSCNDHAAPPVSFGEVRP